MKRSTSRLLSALLALCMVLALLPGAARAADTSGSCGDNVTWSYDDGTLTIQGKGPMAKYYGWDRVDAWDLRAPWSDFREQIHTVKINDGVTAIGRAAFYDCGSLTSVTIPNSVTTIHAWAFEGCSSLTSVYYGGGESQWKQITVGEENEPLLSATIHYNSPMPSTPAPSGPKVKLSAQKLSVDGKNIDCEKYNIDGNNYFKLRDLAELLKGTGSQFEVGYDDASKTISITTGKAYTPNGSELVLRGDKSDTAEVSAQTIQINGVEYDSLKVYNIGGNNFFQLRQLGGILGFDVDYNAAGTGTAIVRSKYSRHS